MASFLDREQTVAPPGYSRWLVPPAALAVHLSIGQIYGYSVFNKPLAHLIAGNVKADPAPGDWSLVQVGLIFSVALFFLGASSALFGRWVERVGPRRTMFTSALLFSAGFLVAALGVSSHQLWLLILGNGVLGGIGLGLGYISPVSTLIKWFPDRPGLATGMAIMGFGGGALLGSPLGTALMSHFGGSGNFGIVPTFVIMGLIYLALMMFGAFLVRVPPEGWRPDGWTPATNQGHNAMISSHNVTVEQAVRTPQFWLLFAVLFLNVTAGIGVLGQASVMIQEMFSDKVLGAGRGVTEAAAAGFVGLLSIFNMAGRFFWSSTSDRLGRKPTYLIFFGLGTVLYFLIPTFGRVASLPLFLAGFCVIISMYGGGFATVPAYLRDMFGTLNVGAIHGRLLLAWSLAAIVGPLLVNGFRDSQIKAGVPAAQAYSTTMHIMAGLLVLGFIANLMIRPVAERYYAERQSGAALAND